MMKEFIFKSKYWTFDLITCICFGLYFGRFMQIEADSGESHPDKFFWSMFTGAISYILAFFLAIVLRNKTVKMPSWVWLGVLGSIIFAFNNGVVSFFITTWTLKQSRSITEYFWWLFPTMFSKFISGIIIFIFLVLIMIFTVRSVIYFLKSYILEGRFGGKLK